MSHWQTTSAGTGTGESSARVLALLGAANGRIVELELQALDGLDAFQRLGVTR